MGVNVSILSKKLILGDENGNGALQIFQDYGRKYEATDLAMLLGANTSLIPYKEGRHYSCPTWLSDPVIDFENRAHITESLAVYTAFNRTANRWIGIRPFISAEEAKKIPKEAMKHVRTENGVPVIEYGEYPQNLELNKALVSMLNDALQKDEIRRSGKNYTFDGVDCVETAPFSPKQYPEFEFAGEKYIYMKDMDGFVDCSDTARLSDGKVLDDYNRTHFWMKVEPIEWLQDESGALIAKNALFSGVPFDLKPGYDGDFEQTDLKRYIDDYFVKDMQPASEVAKDDERESLLRKYGASGGRGEGHER